MQDLIAQQEPDALVLDGVVLDDNAVDRDVRGDRALLQHHQDSWSSIAHEGRTMEMP